MIDLLAHTSYLKKIAVSSVIIWGAFGVELDRVIG